MDKHPLPRFDKDDELRSLFLKYCRISSGDIWEDSIAKHKVGCLDSTDHNSINNLMGSSKASLAIHDPPYNFIAFQETETENFIDWSKKWIEISSSILKENSSLYIWLGADYKNHFQPLADFILMMEKSDFNSKSFITLRNQRGFGTSQNWMSIRQELLYYVKGHPVFNVDAVYTEIPRVLKGYYKTVNGESTTNSERSKSEFIRSGNVWVDIQQVFYRMEENVNGCFAQKPLKALERIISVSSEENDLVIDLFSHSGTSLLACEKLKRMCLTTDIDPVFCEISIRRLENYRNTGKTGWQNSNPFYQEIINDKKIKKYLTQNYKIKY